MRRHQTGPAKGVKAEGEKDQGLEGQPLGESSAAQPRQWGRQAKVPSTVTVGVRPSGPGAVRGKWEAEAAALTSLESAS